MVCPHCGNLRSVCSDPDVPWYPQRSVCYATAARELTGRRVRERYKSKPGTEVLHPTDGVSIWMAQDDLGTADDFFA